MKKSMLKLSLATAIATAFIGCGGGSSSSPNNGSGNDDSENTDVTVVDGYIKNATVTDSAGNIATFLGNGVYRFTGSVSYPISVTGGQYADTNESFDITMSSYSGTVVNPLTTLIGSGDSEILSALSAATGLSADIKDYAKDYVDSNNTDLAKISQYAYNIIKNNLKTDFKTNIGGVSDLNDFKTALTTTINNSSLDSFHKQLAINFNTNVDSFTGATKDFETILNQSKLAYTKTGDYDDADGDLIPNWVEIKLGYNPADGSDINASADTDNDGIPDYNEIYYAEALGDYDGIDFYGVSGFNVSSPNTSVLNWEINATSNGNIIKIKDSYANDNNLVKYQIADETFFGNYADAQNFCANLNTGGYTDWRLPSENDNRIFNPSYRDYFIDIKKLARNIDKIRTIDIYGNADIWTSTEIENDPDSMKLIKVFSLWKKKVNDGRTTIFAGFSDTKKIRDFNTICIRED